VERGRPYDVIREVVRGDEARGNLRVSVGGAVDSFRPERRDRARGITFARKRGLSWKIQRKNRL